VLDDEREGGKGRWAILVGEAELGADEAGNPVHPFPPQPVPLATASWAAAGRTLRCRFGVICAMSPPSRSDSSVLAIDPPGVRLGLSPDRSDRSDLYDVEWGSGGMSPSPGLK
jgi:hypothetical protein